jgi:hypothetical protein
MKKKTLARFLVLVIILLMASVTRVDATLWYCHHFYTCGPWAMWLCNQDEKPIAYGCLIFCHEEQKWYQCPEWTK